MLWLASHTFPFYILSIRNSEFCPLGTEIWLLLEIWLKAVNFNVFLHDMPSDGLIR